jgi:membrane-anchored glycerophosphoryl diester phosphodiesterase (GDPDase)
MGKKAGLWVLMAAVMFMLRLRLIFALPGSTGGTILTH